MLSLLVPLLLGPSARLPDTVTAFVNVAVVSMDRERTLLGQTVLVAQGRIVALGPAGTVSVPASAVRVNGQGKWLIPGLADMHVHTSFDPKQMLAYLATGVTTIRDMGAPPNGDAQAANFAVRERIRAGALLGPTIYLASPQVHAIDSPEAAVALVEQFKATGFDLIKVYSPEFDQATLDSFVTAAHRMQMPFGGHTPIGVKLEDWINAHPVTIEHLEGYWQVWVRKYCSGRPPDPDPTTVSYAWVEDTIAKTGGAALDDSALAALARATQRAGVWNVPTLTIQKISDAGRPPAQHQLVMRLNGRIVKALHDAGAGLLVGTDVNPKDATVHTELQLLVEAGLTPYEALAAGTRNVALAMGALDSTGTIAVGKRADLVLLAGDPLQDISNTTKIAGVMVAGRWLPRAELDARLTAAGSTSNP